LTGQRSYTMVCWSMGTLLWGAVLHMAPHEEGTIQKEGVPGMVWSWTRVLSDTVRQARIPYRNSPCGSVCMLLLMVCVFPVLSEGLVLKMDSTELVARADTVIYGTVEEIRTTDHVREAIIQIQAVLKGNVAANKQVRVAFSPSLEDSPTFVIQERVLLFLQDMGSGQFQTVGGFQGKVSFD